MDIRKFLNKKQKTSQNCQAENNLIDSTADNSDDVQLELSRNSVKTKHSHRCSGATSTSNSGTMQSSLLEEDETNLQLNLRHVHRLDIGQYVSKDGGKARALSNDLSIGLHKSLEDCSFYFVNKLSMFNMISDYMNQ